MAVHTPNVLPLSRSQWRALVAAAWRELGLGLRAVSQEIGRWRAYAATIPDPELRRDALHGVNAKRGHIDGAAMFWTLTRARDLTLLRTLVRYELLQDFLDSASEPSGALGPVAGRPLYVALADALAPDRPRSGHLSPPAGRDDGGYLDQLVTACRVGCRQLPGYAAVRPLLAHEAMRGEVLLLNHEPHPHVRSAELRRWAAAHVAEAPALRWHELAAAASGWITTHALLALAARPRATLAAAQATYAAYFPWTALTLTLLDGYADRADDALTGNHNYLAYYPSVQAGAERLCESIANAAEAVLALPNGERHAVLLACMVGLYLSKDSARVPELHAMTAEIAAAGGALTTMLLPILRAWRICNGQQRAT